jgi:HEAT repeat protein
MIAMPMPELSATEAFDEALRADAVGDQGRRWELISHLHVHGGQKALEAAARLSDHPDPEHRSLAADVLSELGVAPGQAAADGPLRESSLALLLTMLPDETDPDVLLSIIIGLGTSRDERILDTFLTRSAHEDARVRVLATFGLARLTDEDFPRLRDALADRLHDDDLDTRLEAVYGLITRGDPRVMQPLLDILESPLEPSNPELVAQALCTLATTMVDPRLRPHLLAERDRHLDDPIDEWPYYLRPALAKYGESLPR